MSRGGTTKVTSPPVSTVSSFAMDPICRTIPANNQTTTPPPAN